MRFIKGILCLGLLLFLSANLVGAEDEEFKVKLQFKLRAGRTYVYSTTSSRYVAGTISQPMIWQSDKQITKVVERTDEGSFLIETRMDKEFKKYNVAIEYFRRNFPIYKLEVTPEGWTTTPPRQPFPAVRNVPIFPEYELGKGDKWIIEDAPFYPGGLIDAITADWEYELVDFVKHKNFNSAHIKATGTLNFDRRPMTIAFLGFFGDPDMEEEGAFIKELVPDSPAEAAGLLPGDRILTIEDVRIKGWWDIPELLPYLPPGEEVTVVYERDDEELEVAFASEIVSLGEVEGEGIFTFDIYFGVSRGHIITLEGKTDNFTLRIFANGVEEQKVITSRVYMEYLPEG